jgi:hypothetical protein
MKRLILGFGVAFAVAFTSEVSLAQNPLSCATTVGCNALCVQLAGQAASEWTLDGALSLELECNHGSVERTSSTVAVMRGGPVNGPDCFIVFSNNASGAKAAVELQEDFCFSEAGNIHVGPNAGAVPVYTSQVGQNPSPGNPGTPGIVTITAFDATSCVGCDTAKASGKVSRIGTPTGSLKFSGHFALSQPLDLGAATVTLKNVLNEFGGAGELLSAQSSPPALVARHGSSAQSAVFETPAGQDPTVRLELKIKKSSLDVDLRLDRALIHPPVGCAGDGQTELQNVGLSIDDGKNASVTVLPLHRWTCRTDKTGAITELELVEPLTTPPVAGRR